MEFEHLDAALFHLQGKVVVVLLGFMNPDDIVEEQIVAVAGSQTLMANEGLQTITVRSLPTSECTPSSPILCLPE
jgi:hypothetical protein